ncbi:MAG: ribonuclease P protein component [Candidatus Peribacteria bacterium]|jgi:ribonuclease P protein component|nr:ribonuclease P protein component [Candidatus Peribacteria bacterium]
MLAKKFRLTESEVKKVLKRQEPFFSYGIVLCRLKNMYNHNRYAIVISSKSVHSNVERNFFRRKFYEYFRVKIDKKSENDSNFEKDSKFKKLDSSISFQNLDSKTLENLDLQALENAILFK